MEGPDLSRYTGLLCESCKKPFTDNDDIVVCPDCGAPHHRSCYEAQHRCALQDKHSDKFVWQAQKPDADSAQPQAQTVICPECNTANPPHGRYCQMCGTPLENGGSQGAPGGYGQYGRGPQGYDGGQPGPDFVPGDSTFEHWDINGISSRELSAYTGSSSYYFLRQFKLILHTQHNMSWNWSALIFGFFYFFYRKMYKVGLALLGFYIVSNVPAFLPYLGTPDATTEMMGVVIAYNSQVAAQIAPLVRFLSPMRLFVSIWCAIFANKLYLKNTLQSIQRFKELYDIPEGTPEYYSGLYYYGRPNRLIVLLICFGFFAAYSVLANFVQISPV